MKKVLKFATGQEVPDGAIYLCTIKNGFMPIIETEKQDYQFVWHYFLVEVNEI